MNDSDAVVFARGLIRQYRDGAHDYAECRALQFDACGDPVGAEAWRRVVAAIDGEAMRDTAD